MLLQNLTSKNVKTISKEKQKRVKGGTNNVIIIEDLNI